MAGNDTGVWDLMSALESVDALSAAEAVRSGLALELSSGDMCGVLKRGAPTLGMFASVLEKTEALLVTGRTSGTGFVALDEVKLTAPIRNPGKVLAVGKNYLDHSLEVGHMEMPASAYPNGFVKVASSIIGHGDHIEMPAISNQIDYEVELAVVIGREAHRVTADRAFDYVAGYTILNDITARDVQKVERSTGNHLLAKNFASFCPLGPWIVTPDEIGDPENLAIELRVNGQVRQSSSTSRMLTGIAELIEVWSWMRLEAGDIIATGTPSGVASSGRFPYLAPGDMIECEIESIGVLRNWILESDNENVYSDKN